MNKYLKLITLIIAGALVAAACTTDSSTDVDTEDESSETSTEDTENASGAFGEGCETQISIEGSSTVEPISTRVAELYAEQCEGSIINVGGQGTGDGFSAFCNDETDISDASRPIKDEEAELCAENGVEYVELQVAFDGITVMTNPNNEAVQCLAFPDLYALLGAEAEGFEQWSDADELATAVGGTATPYPQASLDVFAPGTESGTYDSFAEIVLEDIGDDRAESGEASEDGIAAVAEGRYVRTDYTANADDNLIINGIAGSDSSLGWVGFAFAEASADQVKILEVAAQDGECVAPTAETIADGSYPVSRSLYIYVKLDSIENNPAIVPFVDFYLGEAYIESVTMPNPTSGYIALPDDLLSETTAAWEEAKA